MTGHLRRTILYIKVSPVLPSMRMVGTGKAYEDMPQAAVDTSRGVIIAIGKIAETAVRQTPGAVLMRAFSRPEALDEERDGAAAILHYFARAVNPSGIVDIWLKFLRPGLIVHPRGDFATGFSIDHLRPLRRTVNQRPIARQTYVWMGPLLADDDILYRRFPGDHWLGPRPRWIS
jgi:hypothetical protein